MAGRIPYFKAFVALAAATSLPAFGQATETVSYNLYGSSGLVDTPMADQPDDTTLSITYANIGDSTRGTMGFQITPRLSGAFRYTAIRNFTHPRSKNGKYYDRSFDLRYQLLTENALRPSVTVGLQDFIGTGLYGAEYIVASKTIAPGLTVTGGLGWGRLGSYGAIGSTGSRPAEILGEGGIPTYDRWFRGDVAPFGGVSYNISKNVTVKAEYSSDNYAYETQYGNFDHKSPWNFGLDYNFKNGTQLSLYHAYGSQIGVQFTLSSPVTNVTRPSGAEPAPLPVRRRAAGALADIGWANDSVEQQSAFTRLSEAFATDGLVLEGLDLTARTATVRLRNPRYGNEPEAIGRAARAMSRNLPDSVETFVITPVVNGITMSAITMRRTDLERLENEPSDKMLARIAISDNYRVTPEPVEGLYPKFTWGISPYVAMSFFDPDNPIRTDVGLQASGTYQIAPNIVVAGTVTKKFGGNLDQVIRASTSKLPHVRTDYAQYSKQGDPALKRLTVSAFGRPGPNLYSRATVGYLESMYGGISTELLWKPVDSRLALGAELNYVRQRDFDQRFDFRDYDVVTGHLSAYYDFGNEFHGQLDVGRYLAGDYGATVSLDREFANGWKVGAYATFTDTPFEDFGEGSFDKGIRLTVPLTTTTGLPSRRENTITLQSLTRDGGAKLDVNNRLYQDVRDYHRPQIEKEWGKFWR